MSLIYEGDYEEFSCIRAPQAINITTPGIYKFEVWGAQGGNDASYSRGGYGGYSVGYKLYTNPITLYACVGEAGSGSHGGYNGGGAGQQGGGGASHIALWPATILTIGASNKDKILIAAGGGGGSDTQVTGGGGGGLSGLSTSTAGGGTQTAGGSGTPAGYWGKGGDCAGNGAGGGGGGLYGGGASSNTSDYSGGGGSGYIDGVPSFIYKGITYSPSTSSDQKSGSGRIVVTLFKSLGQQVKLSTYPANAGTLSGDGFYDTNESVTINVVPNPGFTFLNWTIGTTEISSDPQYTFTIGTSNLNICANFVQVPKYNVKTIVSPKNSGYTTGDGIYTKDAQVTVDANPSSTTDFKEWATFNNVLLSSILPIELGSEGKVVKSTDKEYTFDAESNIELYANFEEIEHGNSIFKKFS